jgi:hypothetical protein
VVSDDERMIERWGQLASVAGIELTPWQLRVLEQLAEADTPVHLFAAAPRARDLWQDLFPSRISYAPLGEDGQPGAWQHFEGCAGAVVYASDPEVEPWPDGGAVGRGGPTDDEVLRGYGWNTSHSVTIESASTFADDEPGVDADRPLRPGDDSLVIWYSTDEDLPPQPPEGDRVYLGQARQSCICQENCKNCPGDDGLFRTCSGCRHPRTVPDHAETLASIDQVLEETS